MHSRPSEVRRSSRRWREIRPEAPSTSPVGKAGDCSSHANTGRRQGRNLDAISLAGGSRADRGRGPLDNFLQFRNAGAAIGAGAKRSPDIGGVCGTPFSHSAADGFKSDTVTGADDRPSFGDALGALAGKKTIYSASSGSPHISFSTRPCHRAGNSLVANRSP